MMTVIDEVKELLQEHLVNLDKERATIQKALGSLNGSKPKTEARTPKPGRKARGRKRSGNRADEAVTLIEKTPGLNASQLAKKMKIKPNYLYRVLGELEKQGLIRKEGRSLFRTSA